MASRSVLMGLVCPAPAIRGLVRRNEFNDDTGATHGIAISMVLDFQEIGNGLSPSAES